jgi:hypothetical protein
LAQHHKWDIASLENLYPYERDIYVDLLADSLAGDHTKPALPPEELKEFMKGRKNK